MKAFPIPSYVNSSGETHDVSNQGMELRDYFAAKAMQSLLTHEWLYLYDQAEKLAIDWDDYIVETAFHIADRMMKERK